MNRFIELQKSLNAHKRSPIKRANTQSYGYFGGAMMNPPSEEVAKKNEKYTKTALLVFIENTGALPFVWPSWVPGWVKSKVEELVDYVAEEFEKMLNDFKSSQGKEYDKVVQLEDATATKAQLQSQLLGLTKQGYQIDVITIGHGETDKLFGYKGLPITDIDILGIKTANGGKKLPIRMVYMMNCKGSSLNDDWRAIGAKVSGGSIRNNYIPEPMMHLFWKKWKSGKTYQQAQMEAWRESRTIVNKAVDTIIQGGGAGIGSVIGGAVGGAVGGWLGGKAADEFKGFLKGFIDDSQPVISGDGNCTIKDAMAVILSFAYGRQHGQFKNVRKKRRRVKQHLKKHGYFLVGHR